MVYFNTEEASNLLGVNVSTIKRWTTSGKLQCSQTAGGHRKFEMHHLTKFIEENKKFHSKLNSFPINTAEDTQISEWILKKNYQSLAKYLYNQSIRCKRQNILNVLKGLFLSKVPLYEIYDEVVNKVLHQIGDAWEEKQISVTEEHFASQSILDSITRLQSMISLPDKKLGVVMCMNLSNEMHSIVLKMVDHILEYKGFKVLYSGQLTPVIKLSNIFEDYSPKSIYISSTYVENKDQIQLEFDQICNVAETYNVTVFVGGAGFDQIDYNKPPVKTRLLNMKEVFEKN